MESKTPLRLKLKIGGGQSATPEPVPPTTPPPSSMAEEEPEQIGSEDDVDYDDDWQEDAQGEDVGVEEEENQINRQQNLSHEDGSRERHKKSKKKKKRKEKEKERHKHKHHKERNEIDDDEPALKKQSLEQPAQEKVSSKVTQAAFKELLEMLLQLLQKKDPQQVFAFPVTDIIAPGYSSIITEPMDFSAMQKKMQEGAYSQLPQFEYDLRLICNNCMIYNQPDTIYYKAAKKLLHAGERILSPARIVPLKKELPDIAYLSKDQLGFDINSEIPFLDLEEGSQDSIKGSDIENGEDEVSKFESLLDDYSATKILEQAQRAAEEAAERLTQKKPLSTLGFLRQQKDGTTTLNFLTGCEGNDPNQKEKPITLGRLTGKLAQGSNTLHNYRDDKRSMAKPVKPLNYGTFSSFCPSYDSTFANLSKEESDMVYATYGTETAVQYAESICNFSRDCDMAMHLVDNLLNMLTNEHHSRTRAVIEERKRMQQEEQKIQSILFSNIDETGNCRVIPRDFNPNFSSLHTLKDIGIDTSFLDTLEKLEQREKIVGAKLNDNAALLESLAREQKDRLSKPLPSNLHNLTPPSENEVKLADKVTEGLISVARQVPPGALAPVPIVRRALGITMIPITSESSEQIEVDIEETSSQESTPPQGGDAARPRIKGREFDSQFHNMLAQPSSHQMHNNSHIRS